MKLIVQVTPFGDQWEKVSFNGPINEDSEVILAPYSSQLGAKVVFNLKDVSSVNSCGVRAWINFIRQVETNREVVFEECTPEIINQINMIPNFKGKARIESLYADYTCDGCGFQKQELFKQGKNMPTSPEGNLGEVRCDKCGEVMEMDELEDQFFSFLAAS